MADTPTPAETVRAQLSAIPFLGALQPEALDRLLAVSTRREIARGAVLIREGDAAEALYFVLNGRFTVTAGQTPIAQIGQGEPIGEIAFFAGGARSATVTAARSSEVLELSRAAYAALSAELPELAEAVIRALAGRVVAGNSARAHLEPRAPKVVAVIPVTGERLPQVFCTRLTAALGAVNPAIAVLGPEAGRDGETARASIARAEKDAPSVVLIVPDPEATPDWAMAAAQSADAVALAAPLGPVSRAPSGLEAQMTEGLLPQDRHLVLLRDTGRTPIQGTAAWLAAHPVGLHHHVALDRAEDFARLARFLTGTATGLVFCGGAAYGTAHLGMLKALGEHGYAFDMVGGASMGASMAGGYALGLAPADVMDMVDELFLKSGAMKRYTAPIWSVVDHKFLDAEMKRLTFARDIEDLPLPYFAVATSLTTNALAVLRDGPLWRAMRASAAIPALFPPMVLPDGEVLIDGGLMDNAPLGPMRDLKPGPNIVMNIAREPDWRVHTRYQDLPGRAGALRRMLVPFGKKVRFPGMFSILSRTMVVNAEQLMTLTDPRDDVFLTMPPLPRMGFLDWRQGRALFERSYQVMADALDASGSDESAGPAGGGPDARLRAIAATLAAQVEARHAEDAQRREARYG